MPTSTTCSARSPPRSTTPRWFGAHLPADGSVTFEVLGLSLVGPVDRRTARPRHAVEGHGRWTCPPRRSAFMDFRRIEVGMIPALVGRINYSGRARLRAVGRSRVPACAVRPADGRGRGVRDPAVRVPGADVAAAREELRHVVSASTGRSTRSTRPACSATSSSTTSSSAARRTRRRPRPVPSAVSSRSSSSRIPDEPADVIGDEPIWHDGAVVGWVTSGGYGHHVKESIALGYVPTALATPDGPGGNGFEIEIIGRRRPARLQPEPLFDPQGTRMRQ